MIIGYIVKLLTFPGALMHALWEHLLCRIFGTPIEDPRYLRADEMCGHIEHEVEPSTAKRFFTCLLPFLFNLVIGLVLAFPAAAGLFWNGLTGTDALLSAILLWLGISMLTDVFPSVEDALMLWDAIYHRDGGIHLVGKILLAPFAAVFYAGSYLDQWGITLVTGVLTGVLLPFVGYLFV